MTRAWIWKGYGCRAGERARDFCAARRAQRKTAYRFFDSFVGSRPDLPSSTRSAERSKEARSHGATHVARPIQGSRSLPGATLGRSVAAISFARGRPAPECLDADLVADCARAASSATRRRSSRTAGVGATGRCGSWLAERHGVEPVAVVRSRPAGCRASSSTFAAQLAQRPGRVLVEAPTYDRPLKLLGGQGAEVVALPMDDEGLDLDALERGARRGGDVSFLYTIPTFQNPSGRTLGDRAAPPARRDRRRARPRRARGRPVRPRPLRGRAAAVAARARGRRARDASPRPSRRRSRPGSASAGSSCPSRCAPRSRSRPSRPTSRRRCSRRRPSYEFHRRGAFEPNLARIRGLLRARRDAMLGALERDLPAARPGAGRRAATSSGSTSARDAAELLVRAPRRGVTFVKGADFFPGAGGRASARLAFSFESPREIDEGVSLLASLL